jgi:hypothetical protein
MKCFQSDVACRQCISRLDQALAALLGRLLVGQFRKLHVLHIVSFAGGDRLREAFEARGPEGRTEG